MKQLIEAAFRPPPDSAATSGFAVLPQQTDEQLQLADTHSRLDRVLNFLIRELGYSFLDDARPGPGGGVQLKANAAAGLRGRAGHKSARFPEEEPSVDDDDARMIRIGPDASRFAQYPEDLVLVRRFTTILVEATPGAAERVQNDTFYKVVLQGVRLMHLCNFNYSDVVLTLAYASVYFQTTFRAIGHMMSGLEAAHVCTLLIFLAHSFVLDETCPLRCWRTHVFRKYCTLKVLDAALFRLFHLRGFRLRLSDEEERDALAALLHSPAPQGHLDVGDASIGAAVAILKVQGSQHQDASDAAGAHSSNIYRTKGVCQDGDGAAGPAHKAAPDVRKAPRGSVAHPQSPCECDCSTSTVASASQLGPATPPMDLRVPSGQACT